MAVRSRIFLSVRDSLQVLELGSVLGSRPGEKGAIELPLDEVLLSIDEANEYNQLRHRCHEGAILSPAVISSKSSSEIYIKVDAWKIVRCYWCGTPESPAWTTTRTGVYCSLECVQASKADETLGHFLLALIIVQGIIGGLAGFIGVTSIVAVLGIFLVVTALFSPLLIKALTQYRHRRAVPRYSRNTVVPSNASLLKALPPTAPCPQCDAGIDLKKVGPDMAYGCDHCSATGTIKVLGVDAS